MFFTRPTFSFQSFATIIGLLICSLTLPSQRTCANQSNTDPVRVLMLGDNGHHQPASMFRSIQAPLAKAGIRVDYSDSAAESLNSERLKSFDVLLIYANIDSISAVQEKALIEFVEGGKGLVPVHCATYCFRNSEAYINLVGGQFKEHGGQRFSTVISQPNHELMRGFGGFESWDETYVHHKHNTQDRIVLEERTVGKLAAGTTSEPWTWIRTQGRGRVFYTAWGHNLDTWSQPGFINLLERGIKWSCKRSLQDVAPFQDSKRFVVPEMTTLAKDLPAFSYTDVGGKIPNYTPGEKWGTQGELKTTMQNPLPASESLKHFVTPKQFEVKLWASEAFDASNPSKHEGLKGKPLAMTWDERGRLWLCESLDYPNELQEPTQGRDRIRICEDTDRDGVADKFTVFATQLSIPTAMACYRGGVIVQDGSTTVYLKDTNGDDVADFRQTLITGWGMGDTHGGVSNFQYGVDNWIWAMQGYNDSQPIINGEKQQRFRQGFWRFAVEKGKANETAPAFAIANEKTSRTATNQFDEHTIRVSKLEFMRSTNNNTWGIGISEEGLIFGSTANGTPSVFMPIPNRYYEQVSGWSPEVLKSIADKNAFSAITPNVRQVDQHGGYTAGCGHALYTARNYPKSWWNKIAFVCEPTGHLVGAFVLDRSGAGYKSTNPFNLVASDDEWSAPTMAEVGPDGNVWVIDWYNFIVQHNPTPHGFETGKGKAYESDLRDKKFGRIYRVVYNGTEGASAEDIAKAAKLVANGLANASESDLVRVLQHPNLFWRKTAQRLLLEKPTLAEATIMSLEAMAADRSVDALSMNTAALHAIQVLARFIPKDASEKISASFNHPSPAVRRNAIVVAPNSVAVASKIISSSLLSDSDLQVRLSAILKLADIEGDVEGIAIALAKPRRITSVDQDGVTRTDDWLLDAWTSAAARHSKQVLPELLRSELALSDTVLKRVAIVAQHAARNRLTAPQFDSIARSPNNPGVATAIIGGFISGWPKGYEIQLSPESSKQFTESWLGGNLPIETKSQVIQLASSLGISDLGDGLAKIKGQLASLLGDEEKDSASRVAAAAQMIALEPENFSVVEQILGQISTQSTPELSAGLVQSLASSRATGLAKLLAEKSRKLPPDFRKNAIRVLMGRSQSTLELLTNMEAGGFAISDLQLDQKQALRDHPDASVREKATSIMKNQGGVPNLDRQKVVEQWMAITKESGNATNGKAVYQKHCALCHVHGDVGVNIGPNLTGMAVHPKNELLTNILDPSRSVEGNFRTYAVRTNDGLVLTGMLAGESKTSLELINTQGKREVVLREDIEELIASQKSLMPEGFEGQMTRVEMTDLLEFLSSKGKYVPLPIDAIASTITTKGMFNDESNNIERLVFSDWKPKMVGDVPFVLVDPQGDSRANAIMLHGRNGKIPPKMPKQVELTCQTSAVAVHLLSGIGGWSYPASKEGTVSMIVRIHYQNGKTEDHPLINGEHFADYIRRVDVPKSKFAFDLDGRQIRLISVPIQTKDPLARIELVKGPDATAPVVMAVTVQTAD